MTLVLSDQNFGSNTSQVEAAVKKHEAISADIEARVSIACEGITLWLVFVTILISFFDLDLQKDRFIALGHMAKELYQENYHARDRIKKR